MSSSAHHIEIDDSLAGKILANCGISVERCYQCGKCSAGCPLAETEMDFPPSVVLRMLQTRIPQMDDKILRSKSIWICLTCEMCIARCPMEVDIPVIMDFLRQESFQNEKTNPEMKNVIAFHKSFLEIVKSTGRLHEVGLIKNYKLKTFNLLQDVMLAPKMFSKGKLHLLPEKIKDLSVLQRIFKKTLDKK